MMSKLLMIIIMMIMMKVFMIMVMILMTLLPAATNKSIQTLQGTLCRRSCLLQRIVSTNCFTIALQLLSLKTWILNLPITFRMIKTSTSIIEIISSLCAAAGYIEKRQGLRTTCDNALQSQGPAGTT